MCGGGLRGVHMQACACAHDMWKLEGADVECLLALLSVLFKESGSLAEPKVCCFCCPGSQIIPGSPCVCLPCFDITSDQCMYLAF